MSLTTDPNDPRLRRGADTEARGMNEVYLVLSDEEIAKGYVRPYRDAYKHVGLSPEHPLRELTTEEKERYGKYEYVLFEVYPESMAPVTGRFWTQAQLDNKGCGMMTTIGGGFAQTYARNPKFYGATYCAHCCKHLPVAEFRWVVDGQVVGS